MAQESPKDYKNSGFGTKSIHAGQAPHPIHGAVVPGIEMASTYAQASPGVHRGFEYSRTGNPTRVVLENLIASTENAKYGIAFSSGSAATGSIISILKTGDHVISIDDVYGGTNRYMRHIAETVKGMKISFVELASNNATELLEKAIASHPNTRMVWLETPTNPTLKIVDIPKLSKIAHKHNLLVVVDNTFATPFNQLPLEFGADIVVHSITKYLNGHSDIVMGIALTNNDNLRDRLRFVQNSLGAVPSPFDCYMVIRGMKTLQVRMEKHAENAAKLAVFLEKHPKVDKVYYPFLRSHPNYKLAINQMKTGGGMITFFLKGGLKESRQFLENLKLFILAESLGAVESLAEHPAIMTHASVPAEQRKIIGISDNLIRLSVGIEDYDDIVKDISNALDHVKVSSLSSKL